MRWRSVIGIQPPASIVEALILVRIPKRKAPTPRPGLAARGTTTGRPLLVAFDLLGRRWALRVLWELRGEPVGFRALQQRCEAMSSSVLRDRLAELTDAGLVASGDHGYALSDDGRALLRALRPLQRWADDWGATGS